MQAKVAGNIRFVIYHTGTKGTMIVKNGFFRTQNKPALWLE